MDPKEKNPLWKYSRTEFINDGMHSTGKSIMVSAYVFSTTIHLDKHIMKNSIHSRIDTRTKVSKLPPPAKSCQVLELFCNSLCDPRTKKFGDPCTKTMKQVHFLKKIYSCGDNLYDYFGT